MRSLSTRLRVVAFAVAAAAFLVASVAGLTVLRGIEDEATSIAQNAAPSVRHLSEMRLSLIRTDERLRAAMLNGQTAAPSLDVGAIAGEREILNGAWRGYKGLTVDPAERALWPPAERALTSVNALLDRLSRREELDSKSLAATAAAFSELADELATEIVELTDYNIDSVRVSAQRIQSARRRHVVAVTLLDAAALVLALATFFAAHKRIRRREKDIEHRIAELDEFAGRAAHDLTSPLTTASLALETVTSSPGIDPKVYRMAERGQNGIRRALDLVRSLLAFARAGAKPSPGERADAIEIARAVIEETRPLATSHGVELVTECSTGESLEAACEPVLLTVVLRNLIHNALKYMPASGLRRVTVRAMRMRSLVRLEVEDTGTGVPEDLRKRVFEPYWRGAHGGRPGIGLGLATVRRIVEAHGGRVSIEAPPRGALFRVDLPAALDEKAAAYSRSWISRLRRVLIIT